MNTFSYTRVLFELTQRVNPLIFFKGKITSFVLYLYTTFQAVSFLTNVDRRCPLLGILLQV
ncbi:hypothetical protein Hanom_Chr09g00865411 [Helianthus anomalus]